MQDKDCTDKKTLKIAKNRVVMYRFVSHMKLIVCEGEKLMIFFLDNISLCGVSVRTTTKWFVL